MTFMELYNKLSAKYSEEYKCSWDNDGIMCAYNLSADVKRVLVALDVTMDTVNYAIENGYDTVISHHPLVFRSQKSLNPLNYTQEKLIKLIRNNIQVMSFHTRLDASNPGVNDALVSLLGLKDVIVDESNMMGRIGVLFEKMELPEFARLVKKQLNTPVVLFNGNREVKKIYVIGGDGKDLIEDAIKMGADTILTGRASYNTTIDANDMGLNIVEAGHFFTENPVCQLVKNDVLSICPSLEVEIFNSNSIKFV